MILVKGPSTRSGILVVERTPALDDLHRRMVQTLNPLRGGSRPQLWEERRGRYGPKELEHLANVGFPEALELWSPHFTIGKVAPDRAEAVNAVVGPVRFAGLADRAGIGTVGEHGSFPRVLGTAAFRTSRVD